MLERLFQNAFEVLFGTPRRLSVTLFTLLALFVWMHPGMLRDITNSLLCEIQPLVRPVLTLAILIFGIRWLLMGPPGNKKGRR